ncbi:ferredoxin, partial [[Kitasatospora] papulosa]
MHVTTDHDRCVGSGQCAMQSPEVFDQDDDGLGGVEHGGAG